MKTIAIVAMVMLAIMLVAGTYAVLAQSRQATRTCSDCNNECTQTSNCGSPSCGAANGGNCICSQESGCGNCNGSCGLSKCSGTSSAKTCGCSK